MLSEAELVILGRAALAAVLGLVIGWERKVTGSAVGERTIALAALTSATLTALGLELFVTGTDRIVQGLVTGIGFLGAGVIIHGASGQIRGLTTAASMWAMSAVGVAVGSGHPLLGILLAVLIYLIMAWGQWPVLLRLRKRLSGPGMAEGGEPASSPPLRTGRPRLRRSPMRRDRSEPPYPKNQDAGSSSIPSTTSRGSR